MIEIRRVQDELNEIGWRFSMFNDGKVVLREFTQYSRPTKRHNLRVVRKYDRLDQRHNTISLEEVPWDEALVEEVKKKILEMITVVKDI